MGELADKKMLGAARSALVRPVAARGFMTTAPRAGSSGMYGFSPVKTDQHVERWASHREDIENTFHYTPKTNARLAVFVVAIPLMIYAATVSEFKATNKNYGADNDKNSRGNV